MLPLYLTLALPTQSHPTQTLVHFLDAPFPFYQKQSGPFGYLYRATAKEVEVEVEGRVGVRGEAEEERWPPARPGDVGTTCHFVFL